MSTRAAPRWASVASPEPGWSAEVALEARSADRGVGAFAHGAYADQVLEVSLAVRGDRVEAMRVRTGTVSAERGATRSSLGASLRARVRPPGQAWATDLGYDVDLAEGGAADLHLLQGGLSFALGALKARVGGGWVGALGGPVDRHLLQARIDAEWMPDPSVPPVIVNGRDGPDRVEARLIARDPTVSAVRVGGLYSTELDTERTRAELYAQTSSRWRWLTVALSGRLSRQSADRDEDEAVVQPDFGLALDGRLLAEVAGPFALWGRYARSFAFLETGGTLEEADLVEGGPQLRFPAGTVSVGGWWARVQGLAGPPPMGPAVEAWGWTAEGWLELSPVSFAASVSRAVATADGDRLGPEPALRARTSLRLALPALGAFIDLRVRAVLEGNRRADALLLPDDPTEAPYAVVDLLGQAYLGAGFRVGFVVANATDGPWSRFGSDEPAFGVDVRALLSWTTPD